MSRGKRSWLAKFMEQNAGLGRANNEPPSSIDEDWSDGGDDQGSDYWENYMGGPEDIELDTESENEADGEEEFDDEEYVEDNCNNNDFDDSLQDDCYEETTSRHDDTSEQEPPLDSTDKECYLKALTHAPEPIYGDNEVFEEKNIVLVDDEEGIQLFYSEELKEFGNELGFSFNVTTHYDASSAIKYLLKNKADLIISNIIMPGINGIEFLIICKKMWEQTPFIILSAMKEYNNDICSCAADSYVVKTTNLDELKSEIKRLIL